MAGSFNHLVDEGRFTLSLIENGGDASEALAECFLIIHALTDGNLDEVERVVEQTNDTPVDSVRFTSGNVTTEKIDREIAAAQKLVETLEPLAGNDRLRVLGAVALLLGHHSVARRVLDAVIGGD